MGNEEDNIETSPLSRPQQSTGSRFKLTISSTEGVPSYDLIRAAWDGKKISKFGPESTLPLPPQEASFVFQAK
jgi:hypothetical protein